MSYLAPDIIEKLEVEAAKQWDVFYQKNGRNFFKDRHYFEREFPQLLEPNATILEVGCGVGNSVFPTLEINPTAKVFCCDFAETAVRLMRENPDYEKSGRCHAFVADLTQDDLCTVGGIEPGSVDVCTMIFVLSAICPEKMLASLQNVARTLKPGKGIVLFRDYAHGDLSQYRFEICGKPRKIGDKFYSRGDGTRCYYFTEEDVRNLFRDCGFLPKTVAFHDRIIHNRKREIKMRRRWIQCTFSLDPSTLEEAYRDPWRPVDHVGHFDEEDDTFIGFREVNSAAGPKPADSEDGPLDRPTLSGRDPCASDLLLRLDRSRSATPADTGSTADTSNGRKRSRSIYELGDGYRVSSGDTPDATLLLARFAYRMRGLFRARNCLILGTAGPLSVAAGMANPILLTATVPSTSAPLQEAEDFWDNRQLVPRLPRMLIPERVRFCAASGEEELTALCAARGSAFDTIVSTDLSSSGADLSTLFRLARQKLLRKDVASRLLLVVPTDALREVAAMAKAEGMKALAMNGYEEGAERAADGLFAPLVPLTGLGVPGLGPERLRVVMFQPLL